MRTRSTAEWIAVIGMFTALACTSDSADPSGNVQGVPVIAVSNSNLAFSATAGGTNPASQSISVTNSGEGSLTGLSLSISYTSGQPTGWLTGSLSTTSAPSTLSVAVNVGTLPPGTYSSTLTLSSTNANAPRVVTVTFTVAAQAQVITLSRSTVSMTATQGGGSPPGQLVSITNGGAGTLTGLTAAVVIASGQPGGWLTASLSSTTAPATLTLTAITGSLSAGTFNATVTVTAPGASARQIAVTLNVTSVAPVSFPLSEGKKWRYTIVDTTEVVSGNLSGASRFVMQGSMILHVVESGTLDGRTAWRLHAYELNDRLNSTDFGLTANTYYLATDALGLLKYSGNAWKRVLSNVSSTITGGTLFLGGDIRHNPSVGLSSSSITVPAGSYQTTYASHYHRSGFFPNAAEDIDEDRREHFAQGIGSVYAFWDYFYEDNAGENALYSKRTLRLTHVDNGPFPEIQNETSGNTGRATAQPMVMPSLMWADVLLGDAGTTLTDAGVGCSGPCIGANRNGQKKIEDWYRFTVSSTSNVRIDLDFPRTVTGSQTDLDLYFFSYRLGTLGFEAKSVKSSSSREAIQLSVPAGTYYIGIQAYDSPKGRSDYWLSARTH